MAYSRLVGDGGLQECVTPRGFVCPLSLLVSRSWLRGSVSCPPAELDHAFPKLMVGFRDVSVTPRQGHQKRAGAAGIKLAHQLYSEELMSIPDRAGEPGSLTEPVIIDPADEHFERSSADFAA